MHLGGGEVTSPRLRSVGSELTDGSEVWGTGGCEVGTSSTSGGVGASCVKGSNLMSVPVALRVIVMPA